MEAHLERRPGFVLMRLSGDLRLWNHPEAEDTLRNALRSAFEEDPQPQLVLNLRDVSHVDSRGIGTLVRIPLECGRRRVNLRVVLPAGMIGQALQTVRIFEGWEKFADEAAAIQAAGS